MSQQFKSPVVQIEAEGLEVYRDNAPAIAYESYKTDYGPEVVKNKAFNARKNMESRRVWGLPVFWMLIAVLAFIIGGAIGGGIGGGIGASKKSSSSPSATVTVTAAAATNTAGTVTITAGTVTATAAAATQTINNAGCPFSVNNGSTYTSLTSTDYTILCNTDITPGVDIPAPTLLGSSIYTCLDACTTYNRNATSVAANGICVGATWAIYNPAHLEVTGQCFLKARKDASEMAPGAIGLCGLVQS